MSKKIEPTDAMVEHIELGHKLMHMDDRSILRTALNHPDAAELLAAKWKSNAEAAAERAERAEEKLAEAVRVDEGDRPWESLKQGDLLHAGDEVRQEWYGVTRGGIVGSVDGNGDPWTAEGGYIGPILGGTWYVRRTVKPLPTEPGTVIVPAEGHEYITATVGGVTYRAREAILIGENQWHAAWRSDEGVLIYVTPERIDAGTWKVGNR